ncbi:MAG: 30S ribosomal protein S4 [Patescibacteria group bacterium]|nr:30S ribosomal protein S4 [Patescibacteria group bacterium]
MKRAICKICRRAGEKLFLKGERCSSPKCSMVRRPYAPGQKGKRRRRPPSEYAKELREKQKLKNWYNLEERQFKKYIKALLTKRGKIEDTPLLLIKKLESRLDNTIFRLGFAPSRKGARSLVSHSFFLVNGKTMNIPSHLLKKGDVISLKPQKLKKNITKEFRQLVKKHKVPSWLKLDEQKLEGKIIGEPTLEEVVPPVDLLSIFEFYSR